MMIEYKKLLTNKMKILCPYNECPDKNRNKIRGDLFGKYIL